MALENFSNDGLLERYLDVLEELEKHEREIINCQNFLEEALQELRKRNIEI